MVVLILIDAPPGLRGHLTRWLIECAAGVYIGTLSRRIRDRLWQTICKRLGTGQALMIERIDNEQGWSMRTAGRDRYRPVDFDGLILPTRHPR